MLYSGVKEGFPAFFALQNIYRLYLAAGQADHDLVPVFNHVEIGDRLTGLSAKALLQFVLVDRKSAHDAKSVRCDERPAFYAKTLQGRSAPTDRPPYRCNSDYPGALQRNLL